MFLHFLIDFLLLTAKTNPTTRVGYRALFVLCTVEYNRGQEPSSMKGHIVNDFGFVDLMDSLTSSQVWYCRWKTTTDNMQIGSHGCVPKNFIYKTKTWAGYGPKTIVPQPW